MLLAAVSVQNKGQASQKSLDAYLRYTGIDKQIDFSLNNIQKQVPDEAKFYIGNGVFIAKTIVDKKIVFQWTFK